ncbi:hypothetical protein D922_03440 [Enterococcus faecalis 06-MB-DW-09]|nr:hypothetical protein D922_03440 [Enterococcus faecalis 06-MB-DW-09]
MILHFYSSSNQAKVSPLLDFFIMKTTKSIINQLYLQVNIIRLKKPIKRFFQHLTLSCF